LNALAKAFRDQSGEVYIGNEAWSHLAEVAGETMSRFLDKYVRTPIQDLLVNVRDQLPDFAARHVEDSIEILIGGECFRIERSSSPEQTESDPMPPDAADAIPGR